MSRRLLALNLPLALLGCALAVGLTRELLAPRPFPPPPASRVTPTAKAAPATSPPPPTAYGVTAAKNLFSPSRSEAPAGPVAVIGPRPVLHGVVMDGAKSRAYLEDPLLKRTFGYAVGDTVGGGRVESIAADRVVIARADGPVEVLLQDPSKPKPAGPAASVPAGAVPSSAAAPAAGGVAQPAPTIAPPAGTAAPAPPPSRVPPAPSPLSRANDR